MDNFLPGVAATLVGVVVALPVALWLNRQSENFTQKHQKIERNRNLMNMLLSVETGLRQNEVQLSNLKNFLSADQAILNLGADTAAWEGTKIQIAENLNNPELYRRLALYNSNIMNLAHVCSLHLDLTVGISGALLNAANTRASFLTHILAESTRLSIESSTLLSELSPIIDSMKRST